jgi:bacteriocin-like protein
MADENVKSVENNQETITPAGVTNDQLSEQELSKVSGGDESPKETVTFEYGGLQVKYSQQSADGTLKP